MQTNKTRNRAHGTAQAAPPSRQPHHGSREHEDRPRFRAPHKHPPLPVDANPVRVLEFPHPTLAPDRLHPLALLAVDAHKVLRGVRRQHLPPGRDRHPPHLGGHLHLLRRARRVRALGTLRPVLPEAAVLMGDRVAHPRAPPPHVVDLPLILPPGAEAKHPVGPVAPREIRDDDLAIRPHGDPKGAVELALSGPRPDRTHQRAVLPHHLHPRIAAVRDDEVAPRREGQAARTAQADVCADGAHKAPRRAKDEDAVTLLVAHKELPPCIEGTPYGPHEHALPSDVPRGSQQLARLHAEHQHPLPHRVDARHPLPIPPPVHRKLPQPHLVEQTLPRVAESKHALHVKCPVKPPVRLGHEGLELAAPQEARPRHLLGEVPLGHDAEVEHAHDAPYRPRAQAPRASVGEDPPLHELDPLVHNLPRNGAKVDQPCRQ
mmetsp:Transcript_12961/g.31250  ORF Transcript_12961/g.31250 Transcript_12961/m.31250 type:complete len:432 (+) Transcript_12961:197-1492(+)